MAERGGRQGSGRPNSPKPKGQSRTKSGSETGDRSSTRRTKPSTRARRPAERTGAEAERARRPAPTRSKAPATQRRPWLEALGRLLRNPLLAAAVGLLVGGLVAGSFLVRSPVYRSTATLLIDQPAAIALSPNEGLIAKLSRLRFKYTDLVSTGRIVEPVAEDLGMARGQVAGSVSASAPTNSLLLHVTARNTDPETARRIAQATAEQVAEDARREQIEVGVDAGKRFSFVLVDEASGAAKVQPSTRRAAGAAGVSGLLVAGAVLGTGWFLVPGVRRVAAAERGAGRD